jgi:TonB-linked SusC/RagA family outer membrane protein
MRLWSKVLPIVAATALWVAAPAPVTAQQNGTVTGTVVDATSARPLESAQVFIPALNMGGLTNQQGRFLILNVPAGTHEIRVELIGYTPATESVTVQAGGTANVEFQLNSTALRLQELVVTGVAGETPRVKLPFSVEKVDFEDMPVPAPSAEGLIQGKVQGSKVVKGSGQPGNEASIMLRGPTSITGSQEPLIIVDGVITDNTMADIDALDVSSIEVVKGAAAASLYGSRAQAGVIQIQTKRGSGLATDESRVIIRNEYGTQSLEGEIALTGNHPYLMDGSQTGFIQTGGEGECAGSLTWQDLFNCGAPSLDNTAIGAITQGSPETTFQDNPFPGPLYDQVGRFFNPGEQYSNYAAVEGRTGSTNYRASFTNFKESGVLDYNNGFRRKNFRLNLDHQVFDNLDISLNTYYAQTEQDDPGGGFFSLTLMHKGADLLEIDPQTGRFIVGADPLSLEVNPLYQVRYLSDVDKRQRFMGSLFARFSPTDWFDLEANYSIDRSDFNQTIIEPLGYQGEVDSAPGKGDMTRSMNLSNDINASLTASFNHAFGDLTTRTKLRYLVEDQHSEGFSAFGDDFSVADVPVLQSTVGSKTISSSIQDVLSEGYFFISALDYQGKYIGDFLVRRDGSSLFGEDERWQTYYRGSAAWRLAQESWWPFDAIGEFKLRYSLGTAGGRPGFSAQYETYSVSQGIITPINLGNDKLKPEFATEQEFGVEMVLWDKVSTGVTYAKSVVEDQLLRVPLPAAAGFQSKWENVGELESNTWEAFLEASVIEDADKSLSFRLNFDRTRQEITSIGDVAPYRTGPGSEFYVRDGEPLGTFYGTGWVHNCAELPEGAPACSEFQVNDDGYLVWTGGDSWQNGISGGLWGTTDASGDYKWGFPVKAENEDGLNFVRLGQTTPDYNVSLGTNFRWKNLSLYALLDSEQGADIYNQTRQWAYRELRHGNTDQAGKADGLKKPFGYYQELYATNERSGEFVEDGSYVKLREMALRYTLDQDVLSNVFGGLGLRQATISLIGRNLKTWTDYTGYDPEVGGGWGGADAVGRIDTYQYPNFRSITAALELIF